MSRCPASSLKPPAVPGQRKPDGQGVAIELGAGRSALVGAALQESVLVAVQVVYEVAVAAVLGDDVDGSCGGTGSGTGPGLRPAVRARGLPPGRSLERQFGRMAKRLWHRANPGSFPASVTRREILILAELYFPHLLNGANPGHLPEHS